MKNNMLKIVIILLIICVVLGVYLWTQNNVLGVTVYKVNKNVPGDFDGYKITHISDYHNITSEYLVNSIVEEIENEKPNIVAITGDLIDAHKTNMEASYAFIDRIKDIVPIYFVPGNHESGLFGDYKIFKQGLIDRGVIVLDNKTVEVQCGSSTINIVGVNDINMNSYKKKEPEDRIRIELDLCDFNKNNYTILLIHRPDFVDVLNEFDIDLALSGHNHGGQIRIPFLGGVTSPARDLFPEYTEGVKIVGDTTSILSRGIGNSLFPFRINNRPELIHIILEK